MALGGLAITPNWNGYVVTATATLFDQAVVHPDEITINGTTYGSGVYVLEPDQKVVIRGAQNTASALFSTSWEADTRISDIHLSALSGNATVGTYALNTAQAIGISGFTGKITADKADPASNHLVLDGTAAQVAELGLSAITSHTTPLKFSQFRADVRSNLADSYDLRVDAPEHWGVEIDSTGLVTATPEIGFVVEGDYTFLVSARSKTRPNLIVSAKHTVHLGSHEGMDMRVSPSTLLTVPYGQARVSPSYNTNNGQAQVPGAAYTIGITNTSTVSHTFAVDVSGLPEGWTLLSGAAGRTSASVSLPGGEVGRIGLYIKPDDGSLPAPGTTLDFHVSVRGVDAPALSQSQQVTFVMPEAPFSYLTASPRTLYSTPGGSASFELGVRNVGNAPGSFPLQAKLPVAGWSAPLNTPLDLGSGAVTSQTVTLQTPEGTVDRDYSVFIHSPAGGYTQTIGLMVHLVSPQALAAHRASEQAVKLGDTPLVSALDSLGLQISRLEEQPDNAERRATLIQTLEGLVRQLAPYPALVQRRDTLAGLIGLLRLHDDAASVPGDLTLLRAALVLLTQDLEVLARYHVRAEFAPGAAVALAGRGASTTLRLTNRSDRSNTYQVTFDPAPPGFETPRTVTLAPGASGELAVALTSGAAGVLRLVASVQALDARGDPVALTLQRPSFGLTVVDQLARITRVMPSPDFVETGASASDLSIHVANVANWRMQARALVDVRGPGGQSVLSREVPITIGLNDAQNTFALGRLDTSGLAEGVYRVNVSLAIDSPAALAGADPSSNFAFLSVGQALRATSSVSPTLVAPGSAVVTTTIGTVRVGGPTSGPGSGAPGGGTVLSTQTVTLDAPAHVSWGDLSVAKTLSLEAGTYDIVIAGGAMRRWTSSPWYDTVRIQAPLSGDVKRDYWLGYGPDAFSGGSPTEAEALALNKGKFVRIVLPQAASLQLWAEGDHGTSVGAIQLQVNKVRSTVDSLSTQVEGALWWGMTRQQVEVLRFGTDNPLAKSTSNNTANRCLGCHVQAQAVVGASDADSKLPVSPTDRQTVAGLHAMLLGGVQPDGRVQFGPSPENPTDQTVFAFWSLMRARPNQAEPSTPDVRPAGIKRYEEHHAALRYNGAPLAGAQSWMLETRPEASGGQTVRSQTADDTISLSFRGSWVNLGFLGTPEGGQADVLIDNRSYGVIDTYSPKLQAFSKVYKLSGDDGQASDEHTLVVVVRGQRAERSAGSWVALDSVDVWDGAAMPQGSFSESGPRVYTSINWNRDSGSGSEGGLFWRDGSNAWFPFTGTSVSYQSMLLPEGGPVELVLDGVSQGVFSLYSPNRITRAWSFGNLSDGAHMLQVRSLGGAVTLDGFSTPASVPFIAPAQHSGLSRYEELDPALRYNGAPLGQGTADWVIDWTDLASRNLVSRSNTPGATVSLTFRGSWASVGFFTAGDGGMAELLVDGQRQDLVNTYSRSTDVTSRIVRLADGDSSKEHTLTVRVLGSRSLFSSNTWVRLDYIDTWDGTAMPQGPVGEQDARVWWSGGWVKDTGWGDASDGSFMREGRGVWFPFTGTSVSFRAPM